MGIRLGVTSGSEERAGRGGGRTPPRRRRDKGACLFFSPLFALGMGGCLCLLVV